MVVRYLRSLHLGSAPPHPVLSQEEAPAHKMSSSDSDDVDGREKQHHSVREDDFDTIKLISNGAYGSVEQCLQTASCMGSNARFCLSSGISC